MKPGILFLLLTILFSSLYAEPEETRTLRYRTDQNEEIGRISFVQSDVKVERLGQTLTALLELPLYESDILTTPTEESKVEITFFNGHVIRVGPHSKLVLDSVKKNSNEPLLIQLLNGKIFLDIRRSILGDPNFRLQTPVSISAVRGTQFVQHYDEKLLRADIKVYEGQVDVKGTRSDQSAELSSTQKVRIVANQFSNIQPIDEKDKIEYKEWTGEKLNQGIIRMPWHWNKSNQRSIHPSFFYFTPPPKP